MTTVLHLSDWHCRGELPVNFEYFCQDRSPDVLVITGDMLEDGLDPWLREDSVQASQLVYWKRLYLELRRVFPRIPILTVPGNHDRIDYRQPWTDPDFHSFDLAEPRLVDLAGIRFSGFRGTNNHDYSNKESGAKILDTQESDRIGKRWHFELTDAAQIWLIQEVPKETQVLVTHSPPHGILDYDLFTNKRGELKKRHMGFRMIQDLHETLPNLRAHLFGHIHERNGTAEAHGVVYSNAATTWNWIDLGPRTS